MHMLIIKFESGLPESEVRRILDERLPLIRATPGLVQKYYTREMSTGHYVGVHVFDSAELMAQYQDSEVVRSIATVYKTIQPPHVEVLNVTCRLRAEPVVVGS